MSDSVVEAILENENFQCGMKSEAEQAVQEALEQALTEHDTILNLIARVEELEQGKKPDLVEWMDHAVSDNSTVKTLLLRVETLEKDFEALCTDKPVPVVEEKKPVGDLKPVGVSCGTFTVVEDKDYKTYLARQNPDWEVQHLFAVTYHLSGGSVTRYVIAESMEGAVSQGCCGLRADGISDLSGAENTATGIQLPLMLRGWNSYQF